MILGRESRKRKKGRKKEGKVSRTATATLAWGQTRRKCLADAGVAGRGRLIPSSVRVRGTKIEAQDIHFAHTRVRQDVSMIQFDNAEGGITDLGIILQT